MNNIYIWGLVLWHWVTEVAWITLDLGRKTVKGVLDAHTEEYWIFQVRNTIPLIVKEGTEEGYGDGIRWSTREKCFTGSSSGEITYKKFDDLIELQLYTEDGEKTTDLSYFAHTVKWNVETPPTLLELVIVWHIEEGRAFQIEDLKKKMLKVFTIENPDLTLRLENCTLPFTGWGS
jgi:hypothetical protein